MNKQSSESESLSEKLLADTSFVVPKSTLHLRACITCCLIKSKEEWEVTLKCENCGKFYRADLMQRTTKNFTE